jgi:predicted NUDIX family phosphoesterase
MAGDEQVLVVETKVVEQIGLFRGLKFDVQPYLKAIFTAGVTKFMPRSLAETNPDFKQIIPYVIMGCDGKFLSYVRGKRAGEKRLVGNRSIGIGGHINPVDDMPLFGDLLETYLTAVAREVEEEVHVDAKHHERIVALLNDDTNEVGKVHLGIVHYWNLDQAKINRREQMITQMDFMSLAELKAAADTMETWSSLCVEHLEEIANNSNVGIEPQKLMNR